MDDLVKMCLCWRREGVTMKKLAKQLLFAACHSRIGNTSSFRNNVNCVWAKTALRTKRKDLRFARCWTSGRSPLTHVRVSRKADKAKDDQGDVRWVVGLEVHPQVMFRLTLGIRWGHVINEPCPVYTWWPLRAQIVRALELRSKKRCLTPVYPLQKCDS